MALEFGDLRFGVSVLPHQKSSAHARLPKERSMARVPCNSCMLQGRVLPTCLNHPFEDACQEHACVPPGCTAQY